MQSCNVKNTTRSCSNKRTIGKIAKMKLSNNNENVKKTLVVLSCMKEKNIMYNQVYLVDERCEYEEDKEE